MKKTIEEINNEKHQLERKINTLLSEFEEKYPGLKVKLNFHQYVLDHKFFNGISITLEI